LPDLREAIAQKTLTDSGTQITAAQVVVTNGGKQAVYQAFATLLDPGDEVLMPTPFWTTYPEAIRLAGGVPVEVFAGADQGYRVTVEQLEAARTPRSKVLLFVSPSNPTGAVYSQEETEAIGRWAFENGMWVVTDEIYQNLVYDGLKAVSITEAVPELTDRTIMVNGVAKTYAMTGWRLGWMAGPLDAMKAAGNLQSHLTSNVSNISQRAAIAALTGPQDEVLAMREAFDRRAGELLTAGVPAALARRVAACGALASARDLVELAQLHKLSVATAARTYFGTGTEFGFDWLGARVEELDIQGHWQAVARNSLREALFDAHRGLTQRVLGETREREPERAVQAWRARQALRSWPAAWCRRS
jgi:aspartate/methionine/tyrosine aminotransferase